MKSQVSTQTRAPVLICFTAVTFALKRLPAVASAGCTHLAVDIVSRDTASLLELPAGDGVGIAQRIGSRNMFVVHYNGHILPRVSFQNGVKGQISGHAGELESLTPEERIRVAQIRFSVEHQKRAAIGLSVDSVCNVVPVLKSLISETLTIEVDHEVWIADNQF
jgi:hypothetical protein